MYLFDTDTITNVFKKKPSEKLAKKLKHLDKAQQFVSAITIFEIVYGIHKSSRPDYHKNNLENVLLPSVNIVDFDMKSAYVCGRLTHFYDFLIDPLSAGIHGCFHSVRFTEQSSQKPCISGFGPGLNFSGFAEIQTLLKNSAH
ncbi:MAG: hypothetical protein DRI57_22635, partial [Deltaproteobacteria bacterium]